jgi:hypothetical protein
MRAYQEGLNGKFISSDTPIIALQHGKNNLR